MLNHISTGPTTMTEHQPETDSQRIERLERQLADLRKQLWDLGPRMEWLEWAVGQLSARQNIKLEP